MATASGSTKKRKPFSSPANAAVGVALASLLVFSAVFILAAWGIDETATRTQEAVFNEQQALQTEFVAESLENQLRFVRGDLAIVAGSAAPDFLAGRQEPEYLETLFENLALSRLDVGVIALFRFGEDVALEAPTAGGDKPMIAQARAWVEKRSADFASFRGKPHPSPDEVFVELLVESGRQWLGFLVPVADGDARPSAALVAVIDLGSLMHRLVAPMRSGKYGAGYVLDDRGTVVFDHEREIIGNSVFGGMHENYPDLLRFDARLVAEPSGNDSYHFTVLRGTGEAKRKLGAWHRADLGDGRFFSVVLSAPDSEMDAGMAALREQRTLLTVVMTAIVLAGSALFFAWRQRTLVRNAATLKEQVAARTTELRSSSDTLTAFMEATPLPVVWADQATGRMDYANPAFRDLFGYGLEDVPTALDWYAKAYPNPDYRASLVEQWTIALQESVRSSLPMSPIIATVQCKNGSRRVVSAVGALTAGKHMAMFTDLTDGIRDRERIAASLEEKETLLRELYHRTKNNLNVIYSLLVLHAQEAKEPSAERILGEMAMRIQSMALVHQMLCKSGNLAYIEMDAYVRELLELVASNYAELGLDIRLDLSLSAIRLPLHRSVPVGLVLNELLVNAYSHAFAPDPSRKGTLKIVFERASGDTLRIEVADDGPGPGANFDPEEPSGMGLLTIANLVRNQLGGTLSFRTERGFACVMELPLDEEEEETLPGAGGA